MCDKNESIMQFTLYSDSVPNVQCLPQKSLSRNDIEIHSY